MSKTKLAILVFCIAFGLNGAAFLFSKKSFMVEEVRNVWLYELPLTASPLDAYVSLDMGPHQGIIGTFFKPNHLMGEVSDAPRAIENLLAEQWTWNQEHKVLEVKLKKNLTYSNQESILPIHFVEAHRFLSAHIPPFSSVLWRAWQQANYEATAEGLKISFRNLDADFDLEAFLSEILTHPFSGPIHPKNLDAMIKNQAVKKDWLSSGPYTVWKWNPKEIVMVSRDDFPGGMRKDFMRTLKFQSAPVKNPSCEFMQGRKGDEKGLKDHSIQETSVDVHVLWLCRSWQQDQSFCHSPKNREALAALLSGKLAPTSDLLKGQKVRYRIPIGSDDFRNDIRTKIESVLSAAGAEVKETSYFFKPSTDADLEIEFVLTAKIDGNADFAMSLALLSSRLGQGSINEKNLAGEIMNFPLSVLMKNRKSPIYQSVFIEPDLEDKKLPL